jgi:hypothetical protein
MTIARHPQVAFDLSALGEMPSISVDKEEAPEEE